MNSPSLERILRLPFPPSELLPYIQSYSSSTPNPQAIFQISSPNGSNPTSHYSSLLQSCIERREVEPGKQLHAHLLLNGLGLNPVLSTKLVNLYALCNSLNHAHKLFDRIPNGNVFLWNVLIRWYAWNGPYKVALSLYYQMLDYGIEPDNFTFPLVLKACSALSAIHDGRDIHDHVVRTGWESDVFLGAALVDMYMLSVDALRVLGRFLIGSQ